MQVRRLNSKQLIVDSIYLAYSAKNKKLSSKCGTFIRITEVSDKGIKAQLLGTENPEIVAIRNLDERDDAWVYDPEGCELEMRLDPALDKTQWPRWTPRLEASSWMQRTFTLDMSRLYKVDREGQPGNGVTMIRMEDPDTNPTTGRAYVTNFPLNWVMPTNPPEWRVPRAERMGLGAVVLPLPPKPVKPEHQEALNALVESGLLKQIAVENTENVHHMRISADLKETEINLNQACHARVQDDVDFEAEYLVTSGFNNGTSGWVKGRPCDGALELYISYLTQYSPYADVFISKDPAFILEHGYVIDTHQPNNLVLGACFATRQAWEKPYRAEAFLALYKASVPLDAAFMFGSQCSQFSGGKMKMALSSGDHNHFQNSQVTDKCMINFLTHKPAMPGKLYSEDVHASSNPRGVDGMWSTNYGKGSAIYKALEAIKIPTAPPHANALPVDDVVERAADIIDDWMGKHGMV